ncbi:hypothetical protein [Herbiconiux solani]|uniref:hypothetical protein n=1 Tax=Herbiconiux solani TaxID=661329 RepID=UPI0008260685|nr:hypothetical protein [Herbiconiux solani]
MSAKLIRLSTRRTGERRWVRVYVYDELNEMREASTRFNGNDNSDAAAVTQAYYSAGRVTLVIIRLWRGALSAEVVGHEVHHAATAIYGSTLPKKIRTDLILTHYNEVYAHLHSDLEAKLVDRLYDLGYYDRK